jgi:hypothetical protein
MINEVAADFAAAVESGRLDLPLPGGGRTYERWAALADLAGEDLSLARLSEGHADALAILAELGAGPPPERSRWGVWAAQPPGPGLMASRAGGGWRLDGLKHYCSGARSCTHALVTAAAPDGIRLFAISTENLAPVAGTWPATGMAGSDTLDVEFTEIAAEPVGEPGGYTAGRGPSARRCWPRRPSATSARTPWPTWAPSTSPCTPPGTRSSERLRRSTRTRRTASMAAGGGPCGCARLSRPRRPRSWRGQAGRSGPARCATTRRTGAGSPT